MSEITAELREACNAEFRAKYTSAELTDAAKAGEAMSGGSYPIKDKDDLEKAIKAVGRGNADHDSIRKHIIARAKALKLSDLIPDNWNADGSLADEEQKAAAWDAEHRSGPSFKDRHRALSGAIRDQPDAGALSAYLYDFDDDTATYESGGKLFQVPYEAQDDGSIELGDPQEVHPVTTYQPAGGQQNSATAELERRKAMAARIEDTIERRDFTASDLEIRETSDGGLRFSGYASTTETPYEVADFEETIARGAFKRTLAENPDVVLLINHEGLPLARTRSGTLTLSEDSRGLRVDADLDPSDPDVQSLLPKMKRQDLTEMSFAFRATKQTWDEDYTKRTILETSIHRGDVSMVTHGANSTTTGSVSVRSDNGELELRAGKSISAANEAVLKTVLNRIAKADEEVDEAQPELAKVLGLPNPDDDEPDEDDAPRSATPVSFIEQAKARKARALREAS